MNKTELDKLIALREKASEAYYEGQSIISDAEFDALTKKLADFGIEETVGHGYVPKENTIVHQYPLLSLKKVRTVSDISRWIKSPIHAPFSVQLKYDGNALVITYAPDGTFSEAATRGNGKIGENVTHTVETLIQAGKIPQKIDSTKYDGSTYVIGEIIMLHEDFVSLNKNQADRVYSNPRNATAGLMRRKTTELAQYLSFVAYDSNHYDQSEIEFLESNNFLTPKNHFLKNAENIEELEAFIAEIDDNLKNKKYDFEVDGAVIKMAAPRAVREKIGNSTSSPRWAIAYKFATESVETKIRDVLWNQTRTGRLVPVAVFDEVILAGNAKTTRATLHNYAQFSSHNLSQGDTILVTRSNEVIPYVLGKVGESLPGAKKFEAPAFYPTKDFPTHLNETGLDLLVSKDAPSANAESIEYSLKALDVKSVGPAIIKDLLDIGLITNFLDMLNLSQEDILSLPGKENSQLTAENTVNALKVVFRQPLARWIAAMGIPFIAFNKSPILEQRYATLEELAEAKLEELLSLDGFGSEKAKSVLENTEVISAWAKRLREEHGFSPSPAAEIVVEESRGNVDYVGKKVVVTGVFPTMSRKDVEAWVVQHGGKISSSVSSSTDLVIAGDKAGSKLSKASELGIQVIPANIFEQDI